MARTFEIRKIPGWRHSYKTGVAPRKIVTWMIVVDGVDTETAPTKKEAERRIRVWPK